MFMYLRVHNRCLATVQRTNLKVFPWDWLTVAMAATKGKKALNSRRRRAEQLERTRIKGKVGGRDNQRR